MANRNVTLKYAHMNNVIQTNHLIHGHNEITSITQVSLKDTENNDVIQYDVRYIDGSRDILDPETRVDLIRK